MGKDVLQVVVEVLLEKEGVVHQSRQRLVKAEVVEQRRGGEDLPVPERGVVGSEALRQQPLLDVVVICGCNHGVHLVARSGRAASGGGVAVRVRGGRCGLRGGADGGDGGWVRAIKLEGRHLRLHGKLHAGIASNLGERDGRGGEAAVRVPGAADVAGVRHQAVHCSGVRGIGADEDDGPLQNQVHQRVDRKLAQVPRKAGEHVELKGGPHQVEVKQLEPRRHRLPDELVHLVLC